MSLSNQQKLGIKNIIKDAIIKKLNEYKLVGDIKPFHERLFSKERIRETSFFHSCSTTLGVTLFQNIAYLIASGNKNFKKVEKQYLVEGNFSSNASDIIENIIFDLGRKRNDPKKRKSEIEREIQEVLQVSGKGNLSNQRSDLFIEDIKGKEIYFEIKSMKPNKGESEKAKRGLLKISSLRNKPVKLFLAMAYNPYEPKNYIWLIPLNYFKIDKDLLIGKNFWDFLAGEEIYDELLNIFKEIGKELKSKIENKIKEIEKW